MTDWIERKKKELKAGTYFQPFPRTYRQEFFKLPGGLSCAVFGWGNLAEGDKLREGDVQAFEPSVNIYEHLIGVGLFGLKNNLLI